MSFVERLSLFQGVHYQRSLLMQCWGPPDVLPWTSNWLLLWILEKVKNFHCFLIIFVMGLWSAYVVDSSSRQWNLVILAPLETILSEFSCICPL